MAIIDFSVVFSRVGNAVLILAVLVATGTHWTVLQSAAWATMLADNLRSTSVAVALLRTFDGKHPCVLCKQIAAGEKSEKKAEFPLQLKKLEFVAATPRFIFTAPTQFWHLTQSDDFSKSLHPTPPTPPPRGVFI